MARKLDLELYRIDLGVVISKYIGETERKLDRLFNEAEDSGAMLFIDEADALFRRRSEVKDAHDRYAKITIDYLRERIENFPGLIILATRRSFFQLSRQNHSVGCGSRISGTAR